jgi:hypothetical protein
MDIQAKKEAYNILGRGGSSILTCFRLAANLSKRVGMFLVSGEKPKLSGLPSGPNRRAVAVELAVALVVMDRPDGHTIPKYRQSEFRKFDAYYLKASFPTRVLILTHVQICFYSSRKGSEPR